jgi:hypothetical protein
MEKKIGLVCKQQFCDEKNCLSRWSVMSVFIGKKSDIMFILTQDISIQKEGLTATVTPSS